MGRSEVNKITSYSIIGLMSGTSLDGVDLAHCTFELLENTFSYSINSCDTVEYPQAWQDRLRNLPSASAYDFALTHVEFGRYLGQLVNEFVLKNNLTAAYVASHGHTIFHQPGKRFTSQIGDGAALASECGIPVICDFRSGDVAYGGQGAPLVPIGDELLFPYYSYCLNLGGFANISFNNGNERLAYDICPANFILNHLASQVGETFDRDGIIAESGKVNEELLRVLNSLPYYSAAFPKSLGREWVEKQFLPVIENSTCTLNDKMRTTLEHIVIQVSKCIPNDRISKMLLTGGGAFNKFLVKRLEEGINCEIILPDSKLINFKEALIFAFLGLLRALERPNCLTSVTGASKNVCGGAIYLP